VTVHIHGDEVVDCSTDVDRQQWRSDRPVLSGFLEYHMWQHCTDTKVLWYDISQGITLFYLPPDMSHTCLNSPPLSWYSLCHPSRDGQAELTWVDSYIKRWTFLLQEWSLDTAISNASILLSILNSTSTISICYVHILIYYSFIVF